jgi:hypothetical protein
MVHAPGDSYRCPQCGASLEVSADAAVHAVFVSGPGTPTEHVLILDGKELHRCRPRLQSRGWDPWPTDSD